MRNLINKAQDSFGMRLLILCACTCALASVPALSGANATAAANAQPAMTITVTNNSGRDMHHLYLSPADREAWGPDLLNDSVLRNNETSTINDVSCSGNEVKVIAEDRDGCFVYALVSCAQASTAWTITSDMPRDCGN